MAVDEAKRRERERHVEEFCRNSRQPERTFVTSPLQLGLGYTFIGIDKHAVAAFGFIGSVRTGFSGAGWWRFLRRSELDAPPGAARRGARVTMYGALWQFAGESALIGVCRSDRTGAPFAAVAPGAGPRRQPLQVRRATPGVPRRLGRFARRAGAKEHVEVPDIELSPRVADPLVRMDWRNEGDDPTGFRTALMRNYELGKVIVLENAPFHIDFDLLNKVSVPRGRRFQKLSDKILCRPRLYRAEVRRLLYDAFGTNLPLYLAFRREVKRLSGSLRDFARTVFRPYRFLKLGVSWRFTPTGPEGLHVDFFRNEQDLHYLRIFMNVDHEPRVWTLSHQLEALIDRYYDEARLFELARAPSNALCSRLNKVVFDRVNALPRGAMDRHVVSFAPGDVWLCETRLNSHEIYSGNRLVATDFYVDPASMLDPSLRVEARVKRSLERSRALRNTAPRSAVAPGGNNILVSGHVSGLITGHLS